MKYSFDREEHLHKLNGVALTGTSSVVGVLAKPLTWWAAGLAVEKFGWLNPKKNPPEAVEQALQEGYKRVTQLPIEAYETLLADAYKAHSVKLKDSAEAGTDLHEVLEVFVKSEMGKCKFEDTEPKIRPYIIWSRENVKEYIASEAHCFSEEEWVGGITDAVAELNDGTIAVIDFKSSKEAYKSQAIQAGGYALQIERNGLFSEDGEYNKKLDKKVTALIIVPFGAEKIEPVIFRDVETYKKGFKSAVVLYRLLNEN